MEFFSAPLSLPQVASYMCQPSPPQSTVVPPNLYPALLPPTPHDMALRKMAPCTLISNPFPGNAMPIVHLPANFLQILQKEPTKYNGDDMTSTCSKCRQTNTLWEIRRKQMADELADDYALKRFLMREIRFEPFPGEEPAHTVANNLNYATQPTDLCKTSNLRANANEFTPALKLYKSGTQTTTSNVDESEYQQSTERLTVTESSTESGAQISNVSNSSNQDVNTVDSTSESYIANDCIVSSHGGSTESVSKTDSSNSSLKKLKNKNFKSNRKNTRSNEPEIKMDNNRNYEVSSSKKDRINESKYVHASEQRTSSRNSDYRKGPSVNGKSNGFPINNVFRRADDKMKREGGISKKMTRPMFTIHEVEGDLFTAGPDYSLAHCVAEDLRMGAGIAVQFKIQFGRTGELLDQRKTVGQVAYLEHQGRYIFYLITKKLSNYKPNLETMQRTLRSFCRLCVKLNVKKLAMPLIGCGLDRLRWEDVKQLLCDEFCRTDIEILIYRIKEEESQTNLDVSPLNKPSHKLKICEVAYPLVEIESGTALVVYGAADGKVDKANEPLHTKYPYLEEFEKKFKAAPKEIFYPITVQREYVCILIVRNTLSEPFSFTKLESSIHKFNAFLKSERYKYVGIERIDDVDPLINDKIISVFRNNLVKSVELYVCSTPPKSYPSSASKYSYSNVNSTGSSN